MDIYEYLKENKGNKFTALDLKDKVEINTQSLYRNLNSLEKSGLIKVQPSLSVCKTNYFNGNGKLRTREYKRAVKLYWVE